MNIVFVAKKLGRLSDEELKKNIRIEITTI